MLIHESEILKVIKLKRNFETTQKYVHHDVVSRIEVNYVGHSDYFSVKGITDVYGMKVESYITITKDGNISDYHCPCSYCTSESACAHIGAILAKLVQQETTYYPYIYEKEEAIAESWEKRLARRLQLQEIERSNAQLERFLEKKQSRLKEAFSLETFYNPCMLVASLNETSYFRGLFVSYRVGRDTKYVIKDIGYFLRMVDTEDQYKYGKNLTLTHRRDQFDVYTQKQIDFLNNCFMHYLKSRQHEYYQSSLREMPIDEECLDDFFDLYKDSSHVYRSFDVKETNEKIKISIQKNATHYIVSLLEDQELYAGKKYIYSLGHEYNKVLYRFEKSDIQEVQDLMEELFIGEKLYVEHSKFDTFYTYAFSNTEEVIEVISDEIFVKTKDHFELNLFGDLDETGRIFFRLECINEEGIVQNGFDMSYQNKPVELRNIEQFIETYADDIDDKKYHAYFNLEEDKTYHFIHQAIPYLEKYCTIYITDALKRFGQPVQYSISVGVNISHGLLEVDFESSDIPKGELSDVLNSYHKKKKFYRLKSGELLYLESNELDEVDQMLLKYNAKATDIKEGKLEMNAYRAFTMDAMAQDSSHLRFELSESFKQKMHQFKHIEEMYFPIQEHYLNVLRDYQQYGFKWFKTIAEYGFGGILADDMGLGKTLQMISVLESMLPDKKGPSIVICPSSILLNWKDEVDKFAKDLTCICILGTSSERLKLINESSNYHLIVTSYDYMRRDYVHYEKITFNSIILDEAQYIKNQKTKNAIAVKKLKGNHRFALTGTPIENTLAELWSIFDFLMPGYLYNYHYFTTYFEKPIVKEKDKDKEIELKNMIEPFILRRMKKEVLKELPDKIEKTVSFEFNVEEKKLYFAHLAQVNEQLREQANVAKIDSITVLAMLTKLRQLSCEPRVLFDNIKGSSSKMKGCIDLILNLKENGKKILLFSSFTSVLDLLAEELKREKISYYMLTGSADKVKRRELVGQFQSDDTDVFLISLKAGGTGINLTSAEAVIHFDPWWNVSAQNQATDRAYRIGQHKNVQVFKLIMKGSVEEKIMELQEMKKELSDTFVEKNKGSITQMNTDEILSLFQM